jgi:hypothetical protein
LTSFERSLREHLMYMRKYADVPKEDVNVVSPQGHRQIEENLHALKVKAASAVKPTERKAALDVK